MSPPRLPFLTRLLTSAVFWILVLFLASGLANLIGSADDWIKLREIP